MKTLNNNISIVIFFIFFYNLIDAQTINYNYPITNGEVKAIAQYNNTTYIGGQFDYVGYYTGSGALLDLSSGNYNPSFPKVNGPINVVISDDAGGWYIGGEFTLVNGYQRNNAAHIKSDMTVSDWNPDVHLQSGGNAKVYSLCKNGNKIYIGGFFDMVGDSSRILFACVDSANGSVTSFNVKFKNDQPNQGVYAIAIKDTLIFLGGYFGYINESISRSSLASVSSNTGLVTNWNPSLGEGFTTSPYFGPVCYGLNLYNDTTLYVWGNFKSIDSQTRWGLASVKPEAVGSGMYLYGWRPNNLGTSSLYFRSIRTVAFSGDTLFVGGDFLRFGTNTTIRNRLAACSRINNTVFTTWNPNVDNGLGTTGTSTIEHRINSLIVINDIIYVGGIFSTIGVQERKNLAAISRTDGSLLPWNPNPNTIEYGSVLNSVNTLLKQNSNNIFIGGQFTSVNGINRNDIAAFNSLTGEILPFDASVQPIGGNSWINKLTNYGSSLFVGGYFTSIGGVTVNNLAKIDATTGTGDPTWVINTDFQVDGILAVHNDTLFVSGTFNNIGDSTGTGTPYSRYRNASIDIATKQVTSFNPNANSGFSSVAFQDSLMYVGGNFNSIGDSTRSYIALINSRTGIPTNWNPIFDGAVRDLKLIGQNIYVAGNFHNIGSIPKEGLAALNKETGEVISGWTADITNPSYPMGREIMGMAVSNNQIYIRGTFSHINGTPRNNFGSVYLSDGTITNFNPNQNGTISSIYLDNNFNKIYVSGSYYTMFNLPATNLTVFDNPEDPLPVELTSFTANILANGIELHWQTATEVNNYGFDILRSAQNKENWVSLGFVNGNGNSNSPKDYSFVDEDIKNQTNGKYYYKLKQIDTDGSYKYSSTIEIDWTNGVTDVNDENNLPKEFSLSQNYPNPFNPTTKIKYTIPVETQNFASQRNGVSVQLKIYNIMGQEIATLVNEVKTPGEYEVEFNSKGLSSGMYFYKIEAGSFNNVKKMILLK